TVSDATETHIAIKTTSDSNKGLLLKNDNTGYSFLISQRATNNRLGFYSHNGSSWSSELLTILTSGNVGIGTPTPTAILHTVASGAKTANYSGNLLTNTATSSTASVTKAGLEITSTGIWNGSSASNIGLYISSVTGGINNYDAIFNGGGNVGIGTASPVAKLDINGGNSDLIVGANNIYAIYTRISGGTVKPLFGTNGTSTLFYNSAGGAYVFRNQADTSTVMHILDSGNVGIGTPTPTAILHTVASGAKTANYSGNLLTNTATSSTDSIVKTGLEIISTGTWNGTSASNIGLYISSVTGGTNNYDAIFNGGGNVGIGTTSPGYKLDIQDSSATDFEGINILNTDPSQTVTYAGIKFGITDINFNNVFSKITNERENIGPGDASTSLAFYTATEGGAPTEKMRISNAGYVGIGETDPQQNLHIAAIAAGIRLEDTMFGEYGEIRTFASAGGLELYVHNNALVISSVSNDNLATFAQLETTFNENAADIDFRIEGDTDANLFFLDASADAIGIGTNAPAAWLHLKAGTNSMAPLRFPAGSLRTTAVGGDMEYDGERFYLTEVAHRRAISLSDDVKISDSTVANTTDETTVHTSAIAANEPKASKVYKVTLTGKYSTANGSDTFTLRFKMGGTTILSLTSTAGSVTDAPLSVNGYVTFRTVGDSGTYASYMNAKLNNADKDPTPVTGSVDTTVSQDLTVTIDWSNADAGNTLTVQQAYLEVLY
ncbi:MAG: hypothetical protein PHW73_12900, partial [Atribacterota bacterium]|nr:hypothetical protein [Atribacterota bacterium]